MYRFSIATSYTYRQPDGTPVVETTWHNCTYIKQDEDERIKKGANLRCFGRIRMQRYSDADGNERIVPDILVNRIESIKKDIL